MGEDVSEYDLDGARVDRVIDGIVLGADDYPYSGRPHGWPCPTTNVLRIIMIGRKNLLDTHYMSFRTSDTRDMAWDELYIGQRLRLSQNDEYGFFTKYEILEQPKETEEDRIPLKR